MSEVIVDEPCPYCEQGYIEQISCTDFISEGNPRSFFFECDHCNGTGILHKEYDEDEFDR